MSAVDTDDVKQITTDDRTGPSWHPLTRVVFRFGVVYLGLFCLLFAQVILAFTGPVSHWLPDGAVLWQMATLAPVFGWVGRTVFGAEANLHLDSNSGDQAAIWVMVFCLLLAAAAATAVWSVLDRRRSAYPRLQAWFLTFLRLCLGGQMLFYGMAKLIPTQMPAPPLSALLQPYGDLSPASVLWLQVGSSHPYEMLLGAAEVLGGLLLFAPRTATLGALVSAGCMGQVFILNMTFDVPVKILSFHLLLVALVLLAPQIRRLADFLVLQRVAAPPSQPALFASGRANRVAAWVQVLLGVWMLAGSAFASWTAWREYGGGSPEPPLYGMWTVTEFDRDGAAVPPLATDEHRWRRLVIDTPGAATIQRVDGSLATVPAEVDPQAHTLTIAAPEVVATFAFTRDGADDLHLEGELAGRSVRIDLRRTDPADFTLLNRGFNWVQEYPYFR
ncbi:DoxX family protein [Mycobacterium sp. ACS4331]|uniref:DoxX family protein n=1 Tax=Mycobacterium sp. ACS4331 TaxID=1834121 RepID=UPI000800F8BB|nr:DoxX family protein [Mycobacterium sp. ACS4331]OBF16218.1 DoxX family protein [Mycobacterium sp. ACS4331]